MTRKLFVRSALGIALALALAACGDKPAPPPPTGGDPFVPLITRTNEMIKLLQDNKADPEKALAELAAYQEQHKAELERARQQVGELMQKDPMKVAAASSAYGIKSAQLDVLTKELAARAKPK
jgi:hypothetical protein